MSAKMILLAGSALAIASVAGEAYAQSAPGQLSEVLVTARKRTESVQNIPVTVSVLTEEQIQRGNLTSIERVAAATPDLQVARVPSGSGADISMRGIGNTATSSGIEQSVAVNVDGVYYGHGRILNEAMLDMRQVEILKGPQSLFFGKNATAGVLSFTTNEPTREFEAMVRLGYEFKAADKYAEAIVSGPLTDTLSARLAFRGSSMEKGYIKNVAGVTNAQWLDVATGRLNIYPTLPPHKYNPASDNLMGRGTLKWAPTDNFDATLRVSATKSVNDNASLAAIPYLCTVNNRPLADQSSPVPCARDWVSQNNDTAPESAAVAPHFGGRYGGYSYLRYVSNSSTLTMNYRLPNLSVSNVTNYYAFETVTYSDADLTRLHQNVQSVENTKHAFSNEIRLQTDFKGPLNGLVGFYYQNQTDGFWNISAAGLPTALFGIPLPGYIDGMNSALAGTPRSYLQFTGWEVRSATDGRTYSPFAQISWDIMPRLQLTAGVRYTHETKKSYYRMPYVNPIWQTFVVQFDPANPTATQITADQKFDRTSPEVALTWRPSDDLTVYGAYKEGFKSGGFSNSSLFRITTVPSDLAFAPETVKGFEAGVKSYLFNRTVRLDVTAYTFTYDNLQVDFLDLSQVRYITYNAGSARTRGAEVQLDWAPEQAPGLNLGLRVNYNNAKYKDFRFAPCYVGQTPAQGCSIGPTPSGVVRASQDLSGHKTAIAPEWTGALIADYERPVGDGLVFGASTNLRYSSSYNTTAFGNERFATQPSFWTWDAGLRFGREDGLWQVSLIGKNLTNEFVVVGGTEIGGANTGLPSGIRGDEVAFPNLPRTVEAQVTFRF